MVDITAESIGITKYHVSIVEVSIDSKTSTCIVVIDVPAIGLSCMRKVVAG